MGGRSGTRKKSLSTIKLTVLIVLLALAGLLPSYISVTLTKSLKHRVYFLLSRPDLTRLKKGDYVMFELHRDLIRLFDDKATTSRTIKIVGCREGSSLKVIDKDYYCDNEYLGKAKDHSLKGEPVPNFVFNGEIPAGSFFVMGEHRDSFDSRYFGFIKSSEVISLAYPLF